MDARTSKILRDATCDFYSKEAASFSETRQSPWEGWKQVALHFQKLDNSHGETMDAPLSLLDMGCGNMRFEKFIIPELQDKEVSVLAIDSCEELACSIEGVSFLNMDIFEVLANGLDQSHFDYAVSFGVAHHITTYADRLALVRLLADSVAPEGLAAISFWQFHRSKKLLDRAAEATERGCAELGIELDSTLGDYLMGWQRQPGIYRYCHSFSDDEVNSIISDAKINVIDDFNADGSSQNLNRYILFR